jgi:hypothetical protein
MSERITIYNYRGEPLTNIKASITRSWVLGGVGEASFEIAYTDPKCQQEYLEYGNFVLVEHDTLPPWVGVIDTPRQWTNSSVQVKAYEAAKVLQWRRTQAGQLLTGSAGSLFTQLINIANAAGDTRIRIGSIYSDSTSRQERLSDNVYQHVLNLRARTGNDFQFTPASDDGKLIIVADWLSRDGEAAVIPLVEGKNIESNDALLSEEGTIINDLIGYGDASTTGSRLTSKYYDETSASRYGLRQAFTTFSGNIVQGTLDANTKNTIIANRNAQRILGIKALDVGATFANLRIGNTLQLVMKSVGFVQGERGYQATVRIVGMKYSSTIGTVELVVKEISYG